MTTHIAAYKALIFSSVGLGFVAGEILSFLNVDIRLLAASYRHRQLRATPCAYLMARLLLVTWTVYMFVGIVLVAHGRDVDMFAYRRTTMMLMALNMVASTAILATRILVLQPRKRRRRVMSYMIALLLSGQLGAGIVSTFTFASNSEINLNITQTKINGSAVAQFAVTLILDLIFAGIIVAVILRKESQVRECRVLRLLLTDAIVYVSLSFIVNAATIAALFASRHSLANTIDVICVNVTVCTVLACRIFRSQFAFFGSLAPNGSSTSGLSVLPPGASEELPCNRPPDATLSQERVSTYRLDAEAGRGSVAPSEGQSVRTASWATIPPSVELDRKLSFTEKKAAPPLRIVLEGDFEANEPSLKQDDFELVGPRCCITVPESGRRPPFYEARRCSAAVALDGSREEAGQVETVPASSDGRPSDGDEEAAFQAGSHIRLHATSDAWAGSPSLDKCCDGYSHSGDGAVHGEGHALIEASTGNSSAHLRLLSPALQSSSPFADHLGDVSCTIGRATLAVPSIEGLRSPSALSSLAPHVAVSLAESASHCGDHELTPAPSPWSLDSRSRRALASVRPAMTTTGSSAYHSAVDGGSDGASIFLSLPARSSADSVVDSAIEPASRMTFDFELGRYVIADDRETATFADVRHHSSNLTVVPRGRWPHASRVDSSPAVVVSASIPRSLSQLQRKVNSAGDRFHGPGAGGEGERGLDEQRPRAGSI